MVAALPPFSGTHISESKHNGSWKRKNTDEARGDLYFGTYMGKTVLGSFLEND
jgi:hypothetical protein